MEETVIKTERGLMVIFKGPEVDEWFRRYKITMSHNEEEDTISIAKLDRDTGLTETYTIGNKK